MLPEWNKLPEHDSINDRNNPRCGRLPNPNSQMLLESHNDKDSSEGEYWVGLLHEHQHGNPHKCLKPSMILIYDTSDRWWEERQERMAFLCIICCVTSVFLQWHLDARPRKKQESIINPSIVKKKKKFIALKKINYLFFCSSLVKVCLYQYTGSNLGVRACVQLPLESACGRVCLCVPVLTVKGWGTEQRPLQPRLEKAFFHHC